MANPPLGEGDGPGLFDELDEHPGGKKPPVMLQCLPDEFHRAPFPVPFHFPFNGTCTHRDWGSPARFGSGRNPVCGSCCPQPAVNGVNSASPLGAARSQLSVTPPLKLCPSLSERLLVHIQYDSTRQCGDMDAGRFLAPVSGNPLQGPAGRPGYSTERSGRRSRSRSCGSPQATV